MNSDLFKGAVESARALHRVLMLASLVLSVFLVPVLLDNPSSLQRALDITTSIRHAYDDHNSEYGWIDRITPLILDTSDDSRAAKDYIADWTRKSFSYDAGNSRDIVISIQSKSEENIIGNFTYNDDIKDMIRLSMIDVPNGATIIDDIVKKRIRLSDGGSNMPPDGSLGRITPGSVENIIGIIPTKLDMLSEAIRVWYLLNNIESITFFVPNYTEAKLTINDKIDRHVLHLTDIPELADHPDDLPLVCVTLGSNPHCEFHFYGYEIVSLKGSERDFEILSRLNTKRYALELRVPTAQIVVKLDPNNGCKKLTKSDCSNADMRSAIAFVKKYGDVPLNSIQAVFSAINNTSQSLQIAGVSIVGIKWICIIGSWILAIMMVALLVNLTAIESGSGDNDLKTYAEIVPLTRPGSVLAVLSAAVLPVSALCESVFALRSESLIVCGLSVIALIIAMVCGYSISVIIMRLGRIFRSHLR